MPTPTLFDMQTTLEDARFFYQKLDTIIRGPERGQDLDLIRRYFRAYLHCWKCVPDFVREVKGLHEKSAWIAWCDRWAGRLDSGDRAVFDCLRNTRDADTHLGMITLGGEVAVGLYPIVMFLPGKGSGPRRELISCCDRGLFVADHMIREHQNIA